MRCGRTNFPGTKPICLGFGLFGVAVAVADGDVDIALAHGGLGEFL